jgi:hypothetical protein
VVSVCETVDILDGEDGCAWPRTEHRYAPVEAHVGLSHPSEQGFHGRVGLLVNLGALRASAGFSLVHFKRPQKRKNDRRRSSQLVFRLSCCAVASAMNFSTASFILSSLSVAERVGFELL